MKLISYYVYQDNGLIKTIYSINKREIEQIEQEETNVIEEYYKQIEEYN